jgi:hypothetical protein
MQDVQDEGCNAIVEWFMNSTPAALLVAAMVGAWQFHLVQLHPAKMCLRG